MARKKAYESEDALKKGIEAYFKKCRKNRDIPNKAGLCLALGISKETWSNYRETYLDAIKEAENYIENAWVQRLAGTTPTGAIFYLKNAFKEDYRDRHENDVKYSPASLTKDDIGAAIDKLPKEQQDALYVHLASALTGGTTTGGAA